MDRRAFTRWLGAAALLASSAGASTASPSCGLRSVIDRCADLEASLGGRLGVHCIDTGTGQSFGHRHDERFPLCSTFKWLAAAAVLEAVDAGRDSLERRLRIDTADLLEWSPVTAAFAGVPDGMTLARLCDAAIAHGDNPAAVKLLDAIGGIAGFNGFLRRIGDDVTRLDRGEPLMNEALPGDPRDTTSPAAMNADLRRLLLGDVLRPASRQRLVAWMMGTRHSDHRLRADLPPDWRLADKTGTGDTGTGTASDVGVYWPPHGAPIVLSVYITRATVPRERQEAAIAAIGRWVRNAV